MDKGEYGRHMELLDSLDRIADAIEEHHKVMSKITHITGFKLGDIGTALQDIMMEIRKGRE
jgi:hypothetical protein